MNQITIRVLVLLYIHYYLNILQNNFKLIKITENIFSINQMTS